MLGEGGCHVVSAEGQCGRFRRILWCQGGDSKPGQKSGRPVSVLAVSLACEPFESQYCGFMPQALVAAGHALAYERPWGHTIGQASLDLVDLIPNSRHGGEKALRRCPDGQGTFLFLSRRPGRCRSGITLPFVNSFPANSCV
jgi:hypothetical protein